MSPKISYFAVLLCLLISSKLYSQDLNAGEKVFVERCQTCHSIGDGRIVGPDLKDVADRREEEWIIKFVQSPMALIEAGDATALKLYEEFNQIPMPDHKDLADGDVKNLIAFISEKSAAPAPAPEKEVAAADAEKEAPVVVQASGPGTVFYALLGVVVVLLVLIAYFFIRVFYILSASNKQ